MVTELHVRIVSARNLRDTQTFGTQDPFCEVKLGNRSFRTRTHNNGGCNPVWNDKFVFNVQDASSEQLALTIRNDNFTEDKKIGECRLQLSLFRHGQLVDDWFTLNKGSKHCGEVNLRLQIVSEHGGMQSYGIPNPAMQHNVMQTPYGGNAPSGPTAPMAPPIPQVAPPIPQVAPPIPQPTYQNAPPMVQQAAPKVKHSGYPGDQSTKMKQPVGGPAGYAMPSMYQPPIGGQPQYPPQQGPYPPQQGPYQPQQGPYQPQPGQPHQYPPMQNPPIHGGPGAPGGYGQPGCQPQQFGQPQGYGQPYHVQQPPAYAQPMYAQQPPTYAQPMYGQKPVYGKPGKQYKGQKYKNKNKYGKSSSGTAGAAGMGVLGGLLLGSALGDDGGIFDAGIFD